MIIPELPPGYEIEFNDSADPDLNGWQVYERGEALDFEFSIVCGNADERPTDRTAAVRLCWRMFQQDLSREWLDFFEQFRPPTRERS